VFPLTLNTQHYTIDILQPLQLLRVGHKEVVAPYSFHPLTYEPYHPHSLKNHLQYQNTNTHTALICFLKLRRVPKQMSSTAVFDFVRQWLRKLPYPAE